VTEVSLEWTRIWIQCKPSVNINVILVYYDRIVRVVCVCVCVRLYNLVHIKPGIRKIFLEL
jgi:hypothetical protein